MKRVNFGFLRGEGVPDMREVGDVRRVRRGAGRER